MQSRRSQVRVHERVLTAALSEVENKVTQVAHVVLLDVDGRASARGERGGDVRAMGCTRHRRLARERTNGTYKMRDRIEVLPLPRRTHQKVHMNCAVDMWECVQVVWASTRGGLDPLGEDSFEDWQGVSCTTRCRVSSLLVRDLAEGNWWTQGLPVTVWVMLRTEGQRRGSVAV